MKYTMLREHYLPASALAEAKKIEAPGATVYLYEASKPLAIGWLGAAQKPKFHYSFKTNEARDAYVAKFLESAKLSAQAKAERKVAKVEQAKKIEGLAQVGDILVSSWGYEQTNIDYYLVTAVKGKSVVIQEIGKDEKECTGYMQGTCTPDPSDIVGAPMLKRIKPAWADGKYGVTMNSYSSAWLHVTADQVKAGAPMPKSSWSSYH